MKYIFDFDDVLFNNTKQFKEHMFKRIAESGVPEEAIRGYYPEFRKKESSMKIFISTLFKRHNISESKLENVYEDIMKESPNFLNTEVIELIEKIGKENCYLVTYGDATSQMDKIKRVGIVDLFAEIFIVQGSKKEPIEEICAKHKDEEVIFIDDKEYHFKDLDFKKCSNLKTILYTIGSNKEILSFI